MLSAFKNLAQYCHFTGTSTAAASPTRHTNDADKPRRTPRSSRSPADSRRAPVALEFTSPSPTSREATSLDRNPISNSVSAKRTRISPHEARLVPGSYRQPADATCIPPPILSFLSPAMKPGSQSTLKIVNTINEESPRVKSNIKTYGNKPRSNALHFLNDDPWPRSPSHSGAKRRKIEHDHSQRQYEIIDIREDEDPLEARPTSSGVPQRGSGPVSRRSVGSGRTSMSGSKGPVISEFHATTAVADPHRKKSRASPMSNASSRASAVTATNGDARSAPILLDDEDELGHSGKTSMQLQLEQFQQGSGISGSPDPCRDSERVSKHFNRTTPKMNHSTLPARKGSESTARKAVRGSLSLADTFKRGRAMFHDHISSDDELSRPVPKPTKSRPKSTSVNSKPTRQWALRTARTHMYKEHGSNMFLCPGKTNEFRIVGPDSTRQLVTKLEIPLGKINLAFTDHASCVRLLGPVDAEGPRYTVDLEFADQAGLHAFTKELEKAITSNMVKVKSGPDMQKIFSKDLLPGPQSIESSRGLQSGDQTQKTTSGEHPAGLIDRLMASGPVNRFMASRPVKGDLIARANLAPAGPVAQRRDMRASRRPVRTTRATQTVTMDAETEPEEERYSEVVGLGPPWEKQLMYGSGRRRAVVDFTDLVRLDNGQFLNDQLIDFYLLYLFDQMKVPRDRVYIFNTHFFTTLTRKVPGQKSLINYSAVARWTSKEDIFGYDYVVVPINQDVHWYLAIICNVSNISRKPVTEGPQQNKAVQLETPLEPSNEPPTEHEATAARFREFIPPSALVDNSKSSLPHHETELGFLDEDESNLNLVDAYAAESESGLIISNDDSSIIQSPAVETARMKKLSIQDSTPGGGILIPSVSPVASAKKTRRKPGPPARKMDTDQPVIIVLDSLGGGARSQAVRVLKTYIEEEGREKRGMEAKIPQNAFYAKDSQIPMQQNFSDCGVYLLGYAQKFFEDPDGFKNRLLRHEMQLETDWPDMPMSKMRDTMRQILSRLYEQQKAERKRASKTKKIAVAPVVAKPPDREEVGGTSGETEKSGPKKGISEPAVSPSLKVPDTGGKDPYTSSKRPTHEQGTIAPSTPRKTSPFEPRPLHMHGSRSPSPPKVQINGDGHRISEVRRKEAPSLDGQQVSPKSVPPKLGSPIVLIPTQSLSGAQSPKRPLDRHAPGDGTDETGDMLEVSTAKRRRMEYKQASKANHSDQTADDGERQIVAVCPPPVKAKTPVPTPLSHTPTVRSPSLRGLIMPVRGSSQDPIPIEDSQDMSNTRLDEDTILVISPKEANSRATPYQPRKRRASSARKSERSHISPRPFSPSVADELDARLQRAQQDDLDMSHSGNRQQYERSTMQEDDSIIVVDDVEIPETPSARRSSPVAGWGGT